MKRLARNMTGVLAMLALGGVTPARADFTVTGRFLYQDREFSLGGFTGSEPNRPIRYADLEVVDATTNLILKSGATDATGSFSLLVPDTQVRDIKVRAKATWTYNSGVKASVRQLGTPGTPIFAVVSPTWSNHASNQNIDFSAAPVVAIPSNPGVQEQPGDAFNILDQVVDAFDFIATLQGGVRPTRAVTMYWASGNDYDGTYYKHSDASIHLYGSSSDSDGYDDSVILHELGHYTEYNLSRSDNPGGNHGLNGYYDLSLTWSEGLATYFQNMVRDWKGLSRPEIYVDTSGQPGSGHAFISYEVETASGVGRPGANNEVTVNALLWDVFDCPSTSDATPGSDDDPICLTDPASHFWNVFLNYIKTASSVSLEDFWDGWLKLEAHEAQMIQTFAARGVEYVPDGLEPDSSNALAKVVTAGKPEEHHTLYKPTGSYTRRAGDIDMILVAVAASGDYVFETLNLKNGADTYLELYASNGTTRLDFNADRLPGDASSRIFWTAPLQNTFVYVRCRDDANTPHAYGSYDLKVSGPAVPVQVSDVQVLSSGAGIELRWRARREGAFSHFDVERGDAAEGPFARRNDQPLLPGSGATSDYAFVDREVQPGAHYFYRLVGVESTGERQSFGPWDAVAAVPARLALHAPSPNPFNPSTQIRFELPRAGAVQLRIFTVCGVRVRTLAEGETLTAGPHTVLWDSRDDAGRAAASGVYIVRLDAAGQQLTRRAVLIR